jgi:hypothetical protein
MDYNESSGSEVENENNNNGLDNLDVLTRSRQPLGLARNYCPHWTLRDAFREFFQNWQVKSVHFSSTATHF